MVDKCIKRQSLCSIGPVLLTHRFLQAGWVYNPEGVATVVSFVASLSGSPWWLINREVRHLSASLWLINREHSP